MHIHYVKNLNYHPDVKGFFSTIIYLGGRSIYNLICTSMFHTKRKGFKNKRDVNDLRMNLGGPSELICLKESIGLTTKSCVLTWLGLIQLNISHNKNQEFTPLIETLIKNEKLVVNLCCYNDGTALKPAAEYNFTSKMNFSCNS